MFIPRPPVEKTELEKARDQALLELQGFSVDDDEYAKMIVHVKTLSELIDLEKCETLSPNTVALILGNVVVALLVVGYERANVMTSKVLSFMTKAK